MGCMHIELAMRFRPRNLIVSDVLPDRLKKAGKLAGKAEKLGINLLVIHADKLKATVNEASGGAGADDIILAVGVRPVQQAALELLGKGGVANLFGGLPQGDSTLEVDAIAVQYDEIKLVGSSGGEPSDMKATLDSIANGDIDPGNYVAGIGSLRHAKQVLKMIKENKVDGKAILYPHTNVDELQMGEYWDKQAEEAFLQQNLSD